MSTIPPPTPPLPGRPAIRRRGLPVLLEVSSRRFLNQARSTRSSEICHAEVPISCQLVCVSHALVPQGGSGGGRGRGAGTSGERQQPEPVSAHRTFISVTSVRHVRRYPNINHASEPGSKFPMWSMVQARVGAGAGSRVHTHTRTHTRPQKEAETTGKNSLDVIYGAMLQTCEPTRAETAQAQSVCRT